MIRKIYEVICDECGDCFTHIYYHDNQEIKRLRNEYGVIITREGHVYCSKQCYEKSRRLKKCITQ